MNRLLIVAVYNCAVRTNICRSRVNYKKCASETKYTNQS